MTAPAPVVDLRGLEVFAGADKRLLRAVDLVVQPGSRLGVLGASGSGKSTLCRALCGFYPRPGSWRAEKFRILGHDMEPSHAAAWRQLRGKGIGLIMQDARHALNPLMPVGDQIGEAIWPALGRRSAAMRAKVLEMLAAVEIEDPEGVYKLFPHQVSGGMGQRVMIAMALLQEPALILADEPTSALDAPVKRQVLEILDRLVRSRGCTLVFVSHEVNLLSRFCDEIVVMDQGEIIDRGTTAAVLQSDIGQTRRLIAATPRLEAP
ncbi:ABC transporter ATP-binding protein [Phenylobacterium sp.]|uniref:ABC transporter ATP-binding protein n=1 Tax=Phenylobacterium sp. TaxID=1871053 RepID=UPI002FCB960B